MTFVHKHSSIHSQIRGGIGDSVTPRMARVGLLNTTKGSSLHFAPHLQLCQEIVVMASHDLTLFINAMSRQSERRESRGIEDYISCPEIPKRDSTQNDEINPSGAPCYTRVGASCVASGRSTFQKFLFLPLSLLSVLSTSPPCLSIDPPMSLTPRLLI